MSLVWARNGRLSLQGRPPRHRTQRCCRSSLSQSPRPQKYRRRGGLSSRLSTPPGRRRRSAIHPCRVPDREAIQKGLDFEKAVSESLGLDLTVASGNRWDDRGDARGLGLRPSCKANPVSKRTWPQTREQLKEAIDMAAGTGQLPLLAIQDPDGSQLVLLRLEDFAEVLQGNHAQTPSQRRSERMRGLAAVPLLRRQQSE